jgi:cell division protein FtsL
MQAAQRKTEYRPSSDAPGKRIVKKDGNVAYIRTGSQGSAALRGKTGSQGSAALRGKAGSAGSAGSRAVKAGHQGGAASRGVSSAAAQGRKTAASKNTIGVRHPVRVGGGSAGTAGKRIARGNAARGSSAVVRINTAPKLSARKAAALKHAKRIRAGAASTILVVFVAFCALSLLISRYAAISAIGSDNNKLKNSINDVQVKIEQLKVDMELQDNIENVRNTALNVLGMKYPDESQKVYIDMS